MAKSLFFLANSNYEVEKVGREVKDGRVTIQNKEFIVDKVKPFLLKSPFGFIPMYFLNWSTLCPMEPKDFKVNETPITPEMLKRSVEQKFWHLLLKRIASPMGEMNMIWIFGAFCMGMATLYALRMFHLIP